MGGIAYLVDEGGTILAVGRGSWEEFAHQNEAESLTPDRVLGRSLFGMFLGEEVRDVYRRLHDAVCRGRRREIGFNYRCDAPETERHMRMSIGRVCDGDALVAVLYQSQLVQAVSRVPIPLFEAGRRVRPDQPPTDQPLVMLCSYCHVVAPAGVDRTSQGNWMQPDDYYAAGHPADVMVSHGICPGCYDRVLRASVDDAA